MGKRVGRFQYFLYCLFIVLPIYQDSPLVDFIGSAGASLMPVVSMVGIAAVILIHKRIAMNRSILTWIKLGLMLIVVSYIALFIWWILGNPMTVYQEWLPVKAIKHILQYFAYVAYVIIVLGFVRKMDSRRIFAPIFFTLLLLTFICIIELTQMPEALRFIHYSGGFPYGRIRLLTKEASWTAVMIVNYSMLSIFYGVEYKKKSVVIISVTCVAVLLSSTGSKSLMGIFAIGIVFFMVHEAKRLSVRSMLMLIVCVVGLIIYIFTGGIKFREAILNDIANYTSVATRSFTIIIGIIIGIIYPFGVGASIFVGLFPRYLDKFIHLIPGWLSTSEITMHIYSEDDVGLAVCSGLFQYHAFWGIVGTSVFLISFFRINKQIRNSSVKNKSLLTITLLCNLVMLAFTNNFTYEFWMLTAIIMGLIEQSESRSADCIDIERGMDG